MSRPGEKWSTKDIAQFFGHTRRHATNYTTKQAGFPKPVIDRSQKTRFWLREQVEQFALGKNF